MKMFVRVGDHWINLSLITYVVNNGDAGCDVCFSSQRVIPLDQTQAAQLLKAIKDFEVS
jgi:hypothetical protein